MTLPRKAVHAWSRRQIDAMDEVPDNDHGAVLISIIAPRGARYDNRAGFRRVLHLEFSDATDSPHVERAEGEPAPIVFNWYMACDVLDFAAQNLHATWHVHCDAGQSRSVAVARFLAEFHGRELKLHAAPTDTFANPLVLRTLRDAAGGGLYR